MSLQQNEQQKFLVIVFDFLGHVTLQQILGRLHDN